MPTTTSSTGSTSGSSSSGTSSSSTSTTSGGSKSTTVSADDLNLALDASQSSVVYVDIPGCDDMKAAAFLDADPPLHVEHDAVRDLWAVRRATPEEAAEV